MPSRSNDPRREAAVAPDVDAESLRLPRAQEGARPQHLILTLFGDYWFGRLEPLPSASLVALASEFEISSASARAALSRLGRRGLLNSCKTGRNTFYGPTPRAERILTAGRARIFSFGLGLDDGWDGRWSVVAFSIPEERRDARHALRTRLRWLGFAPLFDGVWVSPRSTADAAAEALREYGVRNATIFCASAVYSTSGGQDQIHPLSAWNLDEIRARYDEFIQTFSPVYDRVVSGEVGSSEALVQRTAIMDTWRAFPGIDPELPVSVLPEDWPRDRAHAMFVKVYDALGPLAEARFRHILGRRSHDLAELVCHYTSAEALGSH